MLCHVALVKTDVSEELSASIMRVRRIGELGRTLAVTSNRRTLQRNTFLRSVRWLLVMASIVPSSHIIVSLMMAALISSETLVLTRATWHNIPEVAILQCSYRQ
jgi:ABC-type sugar transport system permease subunit